MNVTKDWTDTLDGLVCQAIKAGNVRGALSGKPDEVLESGLAHIFFYGDTVYKLYKTYPDKDHFIKGVLAPTQKRSDFLEHDYVLNRHFSGDVYHDRYSVSYESGEATVYPYDGRSIYKLIKMSRLDFDHNLHEQLQRGEVGKADLFALGYETAKAVDTCPITPPEGVTWYDLAGGRVEMLRQFVDWLPDKFGDPVKEAGVLGELTNHLERHRDEYRSLHGERLVVNLDNHDENVFLIEGRPQFIDLLPPLESWWYGLPWANLSNIMANVEVLISQEAADQVKAGYDKYHRGVAIPEHSFGFTHAFAYLISIAHFGSVAGKEVVTELYLKRLPEVREWLRQ